MPRSKAHRKHHGPAAPPARPRCGHTHPARQVDPIANVELYACTDPTPADGLYKIEFDLNLTAAFKPRGRGNFNPTVMHFRDLTCKVTTSERVARVHDAAHRVDVGAVRLMNTYATSRALKVEALEVRHITLRRACGCTTVIRDLPDCDCCR